MRVIGVAGTAKNTGKTTTTLALLREAERHGLAVGVTSIGYDGEEVDNVTGLPKPRVFCQPGTLVATAAGCLTAGSAGIEPLETLPSSTALGPVVLGRVRDAGLVVLAGPNLGEGVRLVRERMTRLGCDLTIVDGALNRAVPLAGVDGLVLATGAARDPNVEKVAAEAGWLAAMLSLEAASASASTAAQPRTLLDEEDGLQVSERVREAVSAGTTLVTLPLTAVAEPGLAALARFIEGMAGQGTVTLLLPSPVLLLAAGDPRRVAAALGQLRAHGVRMVGRCSTSLLAVTVNPFHPRAVDGSLSFRAALVDPADLQSRVAAAVKVPVIDVQRDGSGPLFAACFDGRV